MSSATIQNQVGTTEPAGCSSEHRLVIEPRRGWRSINLGEIWQYRELLWILAARDIQVRYKQSFVGILWAIISPLFTVLVYTVIFGMVVKAGSDGLPYPVFNMAAFLPWTLFTGTMGGSIGSLTSNARLITKVYFPRLVIPIASAISGLVNYAIAIVLLMALMVYYSIVPSGSGDSAGQTVWPTLELIITLPILTLLTVMFGLGLGLIMGAMNVRYRDVGQLSGFITRLWFYATPVVWPLSRLENEYPQYVWICHLNPMTGIVEAFRSTLFDRPWAWLPLGYSVAVSIALLVIGAYVFRRTEKSFADVI